MTHTHSMVHSWRSTFSCCFCDDVDCDPPRIGTENVRDIERERSEHGQWTEKSERNAAAMTHSHNVVHGWRSTIWCCVFCEVDCDHPRSGTENVRNIERERSEHGQWTEKSERNAAAM